MKVLGPMAQGPVREDQRVFTLMQRIPAKRKYLNKKKSLKVSKYYHRSDIIHSFIMVSSANLQCQDKDRLLW